MTFLQDFNVNVQRHPAKFYDNFLTVLIQYLQIVKTKYTAASLLRSWVRIPPAAWMFVYCECCMLSGRGLCDGLITRPEEPYRMWRVVVCDQETSYARNL